MWFKTYIGAMVVIVGSLMLAWFLIFIDPEIVFPMKKLQSDSSRAAIKNSVNKEDSAIEEEVKIKQVVNEIPALKAVEEQVFKNEAPDVNQTKTIFMGVPFTAQAPFQEWDNPVFQDGCEEAVGLMAATWVKKENLTKIEAKQKIQAIADWEAANYGSFIDTSVADTGKKIMREYFGIDSWVVNDVQVKDIINALKSGKIVIVPTNGRLLKNPHYKQPGPERHNILVVGYDFQTDEFITNDPGTMYGEGYRYKADVLFNAIRDYPSGEHLPIEGISKNILLIWRSN